MTVYAFEFWDLVFNKGFSFLFYRLVTGGALYFGMTAFQSKCGIVVIEQAWEPVLGIVADGAVGRRVGFGKLPAVDVVVTVDAVSSQVAEGPVRRLFIG